MMHFTSNILMISPEKFRANEFTMDDNVFQSRKVVDSKVSIQAIEEFEKLKNTISDNGVSVYSIKDESLHDTTDAVFPNNWISFHHKNNAVIYPMFAENRRFERQSGILRKLSKRSPITEKNETKGGRIKIFGSLCFLSKSCGRSTCQYVRENSPEF